MLALFDLSFRRFVAPAIVKFVYVLAMISGVILYIYWVKQGFDDSAGLGILMLLIVGPIAFLLYLIFIRLSLEAVIAQIRTAENTRDMLSVMQGNPPPGGGMPPQPGPPGPGGWRPNPPGPYGGPPQSSGPI
ncbi:MAG TPA: DUF4282 domain-containing protein [Mycobacteriales bacterium]|nr:DUF4282 domain-containing protein [Mycobacteriales bacterium]